MANEGLSESTFDALTQSPMQRSNTMTGGSAKKTKSPKQTQQAVVPQEQYDALKARFIENETAT